MRNVYAQVRTDRQGAAYAIYAPRGTGKTAAAAKLLLEVREHPIPNGMLVSTMGSRDEPYKKVFAKLLGTPESHYEDLSWLPSVFSALNATQSTASWMSGAISNAKDKLVSVIECTQYAASTAGASSIEAVKNEEGQYPPVLILDDVFLTDDAGKKKDLAFLEAVAKFAIEQRVLVFMLTRDETYASTIIADCSPIITPCPQLHKKTPRGDIIWGGFKWTQAMLTAMLESGENGDQLKKKGSYTLDQNGVKVFNFLKDGMTPYEAEIAAKVDIYGTLPEPTSF